MARLEKVKVIYRFSIATAGGTKEEAKFKAYQLYLSQIMVSARGDGTTTSQDGGETQSTQE